MQLDLAGQTFGKLRVLARGERLGGRIAWKCVCVCGREKLVRAGHLRNGSIVSCGQRGCKVGDSRKHGFKGTATYNAWINMRARCRDHTQAGYANYGGRGISVCERWERFENFLADMGERPEGLSIDRINNDGNYEPSNCRWATRTVQNNNRSVTVFLTLGERTMLLSEWAEELGVPYDTLKRRRLDGWSDERVLTQPVRGRKAA